VYDDNGDSKEPGSGGASSSLYYDSDPEDYRNQTRRPRAVPEIPSESFEERSMLNGIDLHRVGHQRKLSRKLDDETIREITQVGGCFCTARMCLPVDGPCSHTIVRT
jgi:hypothetical protein